MTHLDATIRAANMAGKSYGMYVAERYERNGYRPERKIDDSEQEDIRRCEVCGKELPPGIRRTIKTCGKACSYELNRRRTAAYYRATRELPDEIIKKCPKCGKDFKTSKNNQVYCGPECQQQRARCRKKGTQGRNYGTGICAFCGKQYTKRAVHQVWCTVSCKKKAQRRKVTEDGQKTLAE